MTSSAADQLARIRELHAPVWHGFTTLKGTPGGWMQCHGCDMGSHADDYADWPCRTAEIVYTPMEIEALWQRPQLE